MSELNSEFINELKEIYMINCESLRNIKKQKYDKQLSSEIEIVLNCLREQSKIGKKEYKWRIDKKEHLVNDIELKMNELGLYFERGYWDIIPLYSTTCYRPGLHPYCLIHWDDKKYNKRLEQLNKSKNKTSLIIIACIIAIFAIIICSLIFSGLISLLLTIPVIITIITPVFYQNFSDEIKRLKNSSPESKKV